MSVLKSIIPDMMIVVHAAGLRRSIVMLPHYEKYPYCPFGRQYEHT